MRIDSDLGPVNTHERFAEHDDCSACDAIDNGLKQALRQILEIAYAGHPDGREVCLEIITRVAEKALENVGASAKLAESTVKSFEK